MQKMKRKGNDAEATAQKRKKVQFSNDNEKNDSTITFKMKGDSKKAIGKIKENVKNKKIIKPLKDGFVNKSVKNKKSEKKPGSITTFVKDKKFSKDQVNGEKPKWSEMKKEKKQLRIVRRKAKTSAEVFEISHKAKLLAAQIQRKVVKQDFKINACKELHGILKGQYKSIALTHDLSRVIQVLLKHGPEDIKTDITEELLDVMVQMVQSKYAQHAVKRILKYGTGFVRNEVLKRFYGHIVTLAAHSISSPVLDYAYGEFATKLQKIHMQQEFYGDIYKKTKDDKVKTLSEAYKESPEMKAAILQSCKANIQRILDKNLHDSELFQSVLYSYIQECSAEDRVELISTLSPLVVPLSNSLPGVNAASICVWQGTNKDKKSILKVVKEHAVSLSKHKTGYRLLIAIFDSVDDTVLVKKAIVNTLANNLKDIAKDHWGSMTIHWLVKPKDPSTFHPSLIKFIEEGGKSGTSKKDSEIRVTELREAILPVLKKDMESSPDFWLSDKITMLLTVAVLSIDSCKEVLNALAKEICRVDWRVTKDDKETLAIEDSAVHMCLKKMAALDKDKDGNTLGEAIGEHLSDDTIKAWLSTNRGCFFLLKLIENNCNAIAAKLTKKIKLHKNILKQQQTSGANILLQNIEK